MTSVAASASDLKRELGLFDAVMINAGTMIASAIFIVPATVAAAVQGTAVLTLVGVIGGNLSRPGGPLDGAEGAGHPEAGGACRVLRQRHREGGGLLERWHESCL